MKRRLCLVSIPENPPYIESCRNINCFLTWKEMKRLSERHDHRVIFKTDFREPIHIFGTKMFFSDNSLNCLVTLF